MIELNTISIRGFTEDVDENSDANDHTNSGDGDDKDDHIDATIVQSVSKSEEPFTCDFGDFKYSLNIERRIRDTDPSSSCLE